MYDNGYGVGQDYTTALEWYTRSAELGDPDAMFAIRLMYETGRGVEPDEREKLT